MKYSNKILGCLTLAFALIASQRASAYVLPKDLPTIEALI